MAGVAQHLNILQKLLTHPDVGEMVDFEPLVASELRFAAQTVIAALPVEAEGVFAELSPLR